MKKLDKLYFTEPSVGELRGYLVTMDNGDQLRCDFRNPTIRLIRKVKGMPVNVEKARDELEKFWATDKEAQEFFEDLNLYVVNFWLEDAFRAPQARVLSQSLIDEIIRRPGFAKLGEPKPGQKITPMYYSIAGVYIQSEHINTTISWEQWMSVALD